MPLIKRQISRRGQEKNRKILRFLWKYARMLDAASARGGIL